MIAGKPNPNATHRWRGGSAVRELPCDHCRKPYIEYVKRLAKASRHYCCLACYQAEKTGDKNPNWRGGQIARTCKVCATAFTVTPATLKGRPADCCSFKCGRVGIRIHESIQVQRRVHRRKRETRLRASKALNKFHTEAEWMALLTRHGGRCAICGSTKRIERDHIMPLSRGGTDDIGNIQPLCKTCNCRKNNRLE
jgi:5-methylcytosine-specific restriction endonuclease McrA